MMRLVVVAILAFLAVPAWAGQDLPVVLKSQALLESDVVRLGDLWDNVGNKGDVVVANAPQPGKRITVDARWLANVAQANGLDWRPTSAYDRIVVERPGQAVDVRVVETQIREALTAEGVPGNLDVELTNRAALSFIIPAQASTQVGVRDLAWDARTNRFTATVEIPAGEPDALRQKVNGKVFQNARIPVLVRPISRGDVISEQDIGWIDVREAVTQRDVAITIDQVVGQEPVRTIRPNAPIKLNEVRRPILVSRNSLVTMILKTPYMQLTVQGRAQDDGGKGDIVRVLNQQTKRVVEAQVDGPGLVTVTSFGAPSASALAN